MILPVELKKAYRLLNHGPVVLVSSAHGTARNVMAAAWSMPLDFDPPKVSVVIDKNTYTRGLIESSGEFVLNIPCRPLAQATLQVGSSSGRDTDKFATYGLEALPGDIVKAPRVGGCAGWLECRVIPHPDIAAQHDLFLAEVVAASADSRAFADGHWNFSSPEWHTLHYVAGGNFFVTGETLEVSA